MILNFKHLSCSAEASDDYLKIINKIKEAYLPDDITIPHYLINSAEGYYSKGYLLCMIKGY